MSKEGIRPHLCKNIYPDWTKNRSAPGHVCLRSPKTDNLYNSRNSRWEIHILVHVNIQERLYQWIAERSAIR